MKLMCCPPWMAGELWPHVSDYLGRAAQHSGGWTLDAIKSEIFSNAALLWVVSDGSTISAAVVTSVVKNRKNEKICDIVACGGRDLKSWHHLMPAVEKYAKAEGCSIIMFGGRKGWGRMFPDFSETVTVYEKRI